MDKVDLFSQIRDRRMHERLLRSFRMRYGLMEDLSSHQVDKDAELLDISGGGIRFLAKERLDKGCQLMVELEIPGWQVTEGGDWTSTANREDIGKLQVIGVVAWIAQSISKAGCYEVGLRFIGQLC